jgi:hypothetical protein
MSTRRKFLLDCSTAVAALALAPAGLVKGAVDRPGNLESLADISYAALARQIDTPFTVRLAARQTVQLQLLKAPLARPTPIVPGRPAPGDAGNEKFSLIFRGPENGLLAPAIHRFEHGQLGRFEMYVGQIGSPKGGEVRYEAVFNRPAPRSVLAKLT